MEFKVSGKGKDLFGDGMAFWYVRDPLRPGNVFGNADYFSGLGIFLDTYANQNGAHSHGHPYISAMINNGSMKYDHDRDGTHTEIAGCEGKFRGVDYGTYIMIRYHGDTLSVSTDIDGKSEWKEYFSVSGIQLPTGYFIGVSAATGELSDAHDVVSIKTFELDPIPGEAFQDRSQIIPSALTHAPHREHVHDPPPRSSGIKIFFIVIFSVLGVVGIVFAGIYYFQQKETRKNRFY